MTMSEKLSAFFKGEESTVKHPRGVGFIAVMYDVKSQWRSVNAGYGYFVFLITQEKGQENFNGH